MTIILNAILILGSLSVPAMGDTTPACQARAEQYYAWADAAGRNADAAYEDAIAQCEEEERGLSLETDDALMDRLGEERGPLENPAHADLNYELDLMVGGIVAELSAR